MIVTSCCMSHPQGFLNTIVRRLKAQLVMPNEVVLLQREPPGSLYFIDKGGTGTAVPGRLRNARCMYSGCQHTRTVHGPLPAA